MELVRQLEGALTRALDTVSPAVVRVDGRRRYALSGVAWSQDVVVTTHRAVEREEELRIGTHAGDTTPATLLGRHPQIDLAVLRLDEGALEPPTWTDGEDLRVGQLVLMAGRPRQPLRSSLGILGALEGEWSTHAGGRVERLLQADASPFRGFSGGPLLTLQGEVIGVNSAALKRDAAVTVPTQAVRRTVDALLEHGRIRQGYLGVRGQAIRLPEDVRGAVGQRVGLLVVQVEPESPAAEVGLALGDTILRVGEQPVRHGELLAAHLDERLIGAAVPVRFLRGGEVREVSVTVRERP